jgi:hypothetical protein
MRPTDCLETSVTKHVPTYHLIMTKTGAILILSKSVLFRIFFIPYHLALEKKVKNITEQPNNNTFFSESTGQNFLFLLNADFEVQIGNRSWIIWLEMSHSDEFDMDVLEKITKELNQKHFNRHKSKMGARGHKCPLQYFCLYKNSISASGLKRGNEKKLRWEWGEVVVCISRAGLNQSSPTF